MSIHFHLAYSLGPGTRSRRKVIFTRETCLTIDMVSTNHKNLGGHHQNLHCSLGGQTIKQLIVKNIAALTGSACYFLQEGLEITLLIVNFHF